MKGVPVWYVYILRCSDDSYYVGRTRNLEARLNFHKAGRGSPYTTRRRPIVLEHYERFFDGLTARRREFQIKRWSRLKKKALINGDLDLLHKLSKSRD